MKGFIVFVLSSFLFYGFGSSLEAAMRPYQDTSLIEVPTSQKEIFLDIAWSGNDGGMHYIVKCFDKHPATVSKGKSVNGINSIDAECSITPMLAPDGKNISLYFVVSKEDIVH